MCRDEGDTYGNIVLEDQLPNKKDPSHNASSSPPKLESISRSCNTFPMESTSWWGGVPIDFISCWELSSPGCGSFVLSQEYMESLVQKVQSMIHVMPWSENRILLGRGSIPRSSSIFLRWALGMVYWVFEQTRKFLVPWEDWEVLQNFIRSGIGRKSVEGFELIILKATWLVKVQKTVGSTFITLVVLGCFPCLLRTLQIPNSISLNSSFWF